MGAMEGVLAREVALFRRLWASNAFGAIVEPAMFLLAFGFGIGALVSEVAGLSYIEFIGTGIVATTVLFSTAFDGMFTTFMRRKYQRTYDALLAAPVDVAEIVTAECLWKGLKAGIFGLAPLVVAALFGLRPTAGVLVVPAISLLTGFAFASFGEVWGAWLKSIESFNYVISAVITPIYLLAGTFFPLDELPAWAATASQANPLYHSVELIRSAVFWEWAPVDALHVVVLVGFGALMWRLAIRLMTRALID